MLLLNREIQVLILRTRDAIFCYFLIAVIRDAIFYFVTFGTVFRTVLYIVGDTEYSVSPMFQRFRLVFGVTLFGYPAGFVWRFDVTYFLYAR